MKNELITIGPLTVYGYGLMMTIGVIAAYFAAKIRAKKYHLDADKIFDLAVWCLVGGIFGAKILFYITQIEKIMKEPSILLNISEGFVVYGGIIGGILAGFLFCKKEKLDFLKYFDLVMPSIALAQGFGRLGCFLAGCCYGIETEGWYNITFHESVHAPNGVKLIPTQLISSGLDFIHFFVLLFIARRKKADGQVAGFYLIFYSIGRFILEFYRGDLIRGNVGALTTSQFISIFLLIIGVFIVVIQGRRAKKEL